MRKDVFIHIGVAITAILIGTGIFLSDRGTPDTSSAVANSQSSSVITVPFTKITRGQKSTVTRRVNYIITSVDQLNKLWEMVDATGTPPVIDFKTHAVLAIFAGEEPTFSIEIAKIEDTDARMVSIAITKLDSSCTKKQSSASTYEIVAVPATSLPLTHEDVSVTTTCAN